jgi:hypothetical protein
MVKRTLLSNGAPSLLASGLIGGRTTGASYMLNFSDIR